MSGAKPSTVHLIFSTMVLLALPSLMVVQYGYSQTAADAGGISILSSSSFTDDIGAYHIVGEVKNNSPIDSMNYVKIVATLYDDTGKVVGTDFTYTDVDVLRPAEKSSFEIILTDITQSQKVSSYKLSTSGDKTQALPASLKLSVGDSHLDNIGDFHIVGEVTNQGSGKATFVKISGAFYNSSNSVVAADFTFTDPQDLEPGQTAPFDIIVNAPTANKITSASVNVGSNQYSSINSQVVQVSPNVKSSSSATTTVSHSSPSTLKLLSVSIKVAHDPISRGSEQTVFVKVSDNGNSSKPVSGAHVNGQVIYASHETTKPFEGITDSKGDMNPSYSFPIGGDSNPGTFHVNAHVSAKGYKSASATKTFNVTAAPPQNTTNITNTTITNTTTALPDNSTSSGGIDNNTSSSDNNNTSTNFNPLIPSSGNFSENGIDQQGQSSTGGGENITTAPGGNENDIISSPTIGGGNFSDTGTSHPHHSSKHKNTTGGDEIVTPPNGGSNNGGGGGGSSGGDGGDKGSSGGGSSGG
jgi:hypothetical protein